MRPCAAFAVMLACLAVAAPAARGQTAARAVTFRFVPTARAQIAAWIEGPGSRFATVRLTDAVARRGLGNRPGASQMNSGYHWPYGRREGVLPVWALRRLADGGLAFPRVIFQRRSEGFASRDSCEDSTPDAYYCLSFSIETTRREGLDAVSCASPFNGDKGRFVTAADVANGYSEPSAEGPRLLGATSPYPPRRDFVSCANASTKPPCTGGACQDHPDSTSFADQARAAMPEIDAVTMATPPGDQPIAFAFELPADWPDGTYAAWVEVNTEGDYNASYNDTIYPTPKSSDWDMWAISYGYPFRGQPSVVFHLVFPVDAGVRTASTSDAFGYGSLYGVDDPNGVFKPIDTTISNDATTAPGSGVDRLRMHPDGYRLRVDIGPPPPDAGTGSDAAPDGATDAAGEAGDAGDSGWPPPLCIPGMTVACACVGGGAGAQTCGSDGNHFEACQCPDNHLAPRDDGCGCDCDVGGGAGGPLGIALLALALIARRRRRG